MVKVSVVVPVYNAERYLDQCVNSLIHQTLKEIELIFVDDGSTDRSVEILEGYQKEDNRIVIIQQSNQYAGVARNNGMKKATGKYIIFLDADDFFELSMLEELYDCAEKHQVEIVLFGFWWYNDKTGKSLEEPFEKYGAFPNEVFSISELEYGFAQCSPTPWTKLFLRSFIIKQSLQYQSIKKCNDTFFNRMALILANRIYYSKNRFVYYRINNSESLQGSKQNLECYLYAGSAIKKELIKRDLYKGELVKICDLEMTSLINMGLNNITDFASMRSFYQSVKNILIPDLFESKDAFVKDQRISNIYNSDSLLDYLFRETISAYAKQAFLDEVFAEKEMTQQRVNELQEELNDVVNSKAYKLGEMLLIIPKKIKHLLTS